MPRIGSAGLRPHVRTPQLTRGHS